MKKNVVKYIKDSFTVLQKNKRLLFAGLIDAAFFMLLIYAVHRISLVTQSPRHLPFYATGSPPPYLIAIIFSGFIGAFFLAGKLFMIRKAYESYYSTSSGQPTSKVGMSDYMDGMSQFGFKILVGKAFLFAASLLIVFLLVLPILETEIDIFVGLTPIVFLLLILLISLWDTIMVAEGSQIKAAINKSIFFVRKNYLRALLLQLFAGFIAFAILSPGDPLRLVQGMRAHSFGEGIERMLITIPPLYQGIIGSLGALSWVFVAALVILFNVIAPMILMDFYMDRREVLKV